MLITDKLESKKGGKGTKKGPKPLLLSRKTRGGVFKLFTAPPPRPQHHTRERGGPPDGEPGPRLTAAHRQLMRRLTLVTLRQRESWGESDKERRGLEEPRPRRRPSQQRPANHLTRGWARTGRKQGRIDTSSAEHPSVFGHAR